MTINTGNARHRMATHLASSTRKQNVAARSIFRSGVLG
jgi:hypothetical protein